MSKMSGGSGGPDSGVDCERSLIKAHLREKNKEHLTDELAALMERSADGNCDADLIDAYLEVLDEKDPIPIEIDLEESFAAFREKHMMLLAPSSGVPHAPEIPHSSERKRIPLAFRRIGVAAAAIAVMLASMVTAQAFGLDIFGTIARWTAETFQFQPKDAPYAVITNNPLQEGESAEYDSLEEALDAFGITVPLIPQRIPERFELDHINATNQPSGLFICADYTCDNGFLQIRFKKTEIADLSSLEKQPGSIGMVDTAEIEHYLLRDVLSLKAVWQNGELECRISGTVSQEEMRDIIYSIYEERTT